MPISAGSGVFTREAEPLPKQATKYSSPDFCLNWLSVGSSRRMEPDSEGTNLLAQVSISLSIFFRSTLAVPYSSFFFRSSIFSSISIDAIFMRMGGPVSLSLWRSHECLVTKQ